MKSRNLIQIVLTTVVAASVFLVLHSAKPAGAASESNSCKESLEECSKKKDAGGADKMIWENLSQQFFSTI